MIVTTPCQVCSQTFTYERKYRPRIYCEQCRAFAYAAHSVGNYNPEYARWYRENVRKLGLKLREMK